MIKFGAIVEARMGSTRLPGKVMMKVKNVPMISLLIDRLKQVKKINKIIVATTNSSNDDSFCKYLRDKKINFFRGSEDNVMKRVIDASKKYKIKNIIQITGDCPLVDPEIVSQALNTFEKNNFDFVSNSTYRSYPDGMDVCIFSSKNLNKSYKLTNSKYDQEHVSLFMKRKKRIFSQCNIVAPENLNYPNLGLTLDEKKDYDLIKIIFSKFWQRRKNFSCKEIINFLNSNQKYFSINKSVRRKKVPFKIH